MPFISVKVIEGVFDGEKKQEIIERLTDTMVAIEGENLRQVTWVTSSRRSRAVTGASQATA